MPGALRKSWLVVVLLASGTAVAEPMNLQDPRPRWVLVAFETSPPNEPGRLDSLYAPELPAWLEPAGPGRLRVTLARGLVERYLMAAYDPKPGSFDDFVWLFDTRSGHVVAARLSGTIRRTLDWGVFRSTVEADIRIELDTRGPAGFERPRRWLGQVLFDFCDGTGRDRCSEVAAVPYRPERGYVNAVGKLRARSHRIRVETFAPLGEAVFSEALRPTSPPIRTAAGDLLP
jgi:hypothetical protein